MTIQKNSIHKLIAEIHVSAMEDATMAQSRVPAFLKEKIIPLIEKVADRLSRPGEILRIDCLELELDNFDMQGNNHAALDLFEKQLEEKLRNGLFQPSPGKHADGTRQLSEALAEEELFVFILKEGCLPWWAKTDEPIVFQQLAETLLERNPPSLKGSLTAVLSVPAARKRIAYKLSAEVVEKIIRLVFEEPGILLRKINELLTLLEKEATLEFRKLILERGVKL